MFVELTRVGLGFAQVLEIEHSGRGGRSLAPELPPALKELLDAVMSGIRGPMGIDVT